MLTAQTSFGLSTQAGNAVNDSPARFLFHGWTLNSRLAFSSHGALHRIAGLAPAIVAISIGTAVVEVRHRLLLIAAAAQLDRHI